ncbi:MAG: tetratricopeptide repeat protein, partial [Promethearchaeota archaeon]
EVGELVYSMSQELGLVPELIEALTLKSDMVYIGEIDEAFNLIMRGEKLLNSLLDESPHTITKLRFLLKYGKIGYYLFKGDIKNALDSAMDAISLGEKIKCDSMIGMIFLLISHIYSVLGDLEATLEYAMKGSKLFEKLDFQTGIGAFFYQIGLVDFYKGDLNKALEICENGLSREKLSDFDKSNILNLLGRIYGEKGELNKSLKYIKQSIKLAEETKNYMFLTLSTRVLGEIYRRKGETDQAMKFFKQTLLLSEKIGIVFIVPMLLYLILLNLDNNSDEEAQKYLARLENLSDQLENTLFKHGYLLGKALMLKMSTRMRDKVKAEEMLKQINDDDFVFPEFHIISIVSLCDLLLEELFMYNDPEIINEIKPLIVQLLKIAEEQHSYSYLSEVKLLQAKLALIQMDLEEAKLLLTEAQQIAEERGLNLLAQKISSEHDILLEKVSEWEKLKKKNAPMAERIELASFDGVINRLHGKQAIDPPDLVDEEPLLLMVMSRDGVPYFNYSFRENWDSDWLFSSFMSAFETFSSELFSESIDRIKIGEHLILINPIETFFACYVVKGQSYPALQKLTRFTEAIRENSEIWQALNKSVKTSEMLELDKPPALKTVIDEIF